MNRPHPLPAALLLMTLGTLNCNLPGRPKAGPEVPRPDSILDFATLYQQNCSACHGPDGKGGAAQELADPVYLGIADDGALRRATANGVPGTSMPAFSQSAGGMLTDEQVEALVRGMREGWGKPDILGGQDPPSYAAGTPGDAQRGADVFNTFCASCHGPDGKGGEKASSITDGSYLALVSDQGLRTAVIVGRPDLGAPDWRSDMAGRPMTHQDVSDVVAWLAAQRPPFPGQPYASTAATGGSL